MKIRCLLILALSLTSMSWALTMNQFSMVNVQQSNWLQARFKTMSARSSMECSAKCVASKGCSAYYFDQNSQNCDLGSSLKMTGGANSGAALMVNAMKIDDAWVLMTGGLNEGGFLNVAYLYNWKTQDVCPFKQLPYAVASHTMTTKFGTPIICGGIKPTGPALNLCYKYNSTDWVPTTNMLTITRMVRGAFVPGFGWAIFGGRDNPSTKVLVLSGLDGTWTPVADMYKQLTVEGHCVLQLNDTTTVLFGGSISYTSIVTFSWITMTHTLQPATLKRNRNFANCGALKQPDGQTVAIIVGGNNPGVEMWNPNTGEVRMLLDVHPAETSTYGLVFAAMISVHGGRELMLFGGNVAWDNVRKTDIWNYNGKFWRKVGDLPIHWSELAIAQINGYSCP